MFLSWDYFYVEKRPWSTRVAGEAAAFVRCCCLFIWESPRTLEHEAHLARSQGRERSALSRAGATVGDALGQQQRDLGGVEVC